MRETFMHRWAPRLDPLRWVGPVRAYFAHHGIWAPGVRLLRICSVRSKMVVLMTFLCLPLLPIT